MLYWAAVFLVIAIISGFLGFGRISTTSQTMAYWLFIIAVVVFGITFLSGLFNRFGKK